MSILIDFLLGQNFQRFSVIFLFSFLSLMSGFFSYSFFEAGVQSWPPVDPHWPEPDIQLMTDVVRIAAFDASYQKPTTGTFTSASATLTYLFSICS